MDFKRFLTLVIGGILFLALLIWFNAYLGGGNVFRFLSGAGLLAVIGLGTVFLGLVGCGWFYQESRNFR